MKEFEKFKDFEPPKGFVGGCKQTANPHECILIDGNGKIRKRQLGCPDWFHCKRGLGYKYQIKEDE
jgi:hypothetical protein